LLKHVNELYGALFFLGSLYSHKRSTYSDPFMELKGSLPFLQKPPARPYSEPVSLSPHCHILLLEHLFQYTTMYIKVSRVVLYLHLYWLQFHMLHTCCL